MRLLRPTLLLALVLPVAAFAQQQDGDSPIAFRDTKDEIERNQALGLNGPSERDGRLAMQAYGKCVAERLPKEAARVLAKDFKTTEYRTGLKMLSESAERPCAHNAVGRSNVMRGNTLLFAGSVAEALLTTPAEPLNKRLVRSAGSKAAVFGPTDAVAQCLARSLPDQVAALYATEPASAAESVAAKPLLQAVPACSKAMGVAARVELSPSALRAMTATAAFRIVSGSDHAQG